MTIKREKAIKYFKLARYQANLFSKDPSKKVGSLFLSPGSLEIRTMGYNGMPRKIDETISERWERPIKYAYVCHAEKNCIYNASRNGVCLENSICVVTYFPCTDCAKGLIQVGVSTIVTVAPDLIHPIWGPEQKFSMDLFNEVGIEIIILNESEILE